MGLSDGAKYEIELRLRLKEEQSQDAIVLAHGTADRGDRQRRARRRRASRSSVRWSIANRGGGRARRGQRHAARFRRARRLCRRRGDAGARRTDAPPEVGTPAGRAVDRRLLAAARGRRDARRSTPDAPFGLPFRPSPFRARVELTLAGARITRELPVQFRYEGAGLVGEKRMELNVVPAFAVSVSPRSSSCRARTGAARPDAAGRP